jgi:hypothetical protein
MRFLCIYRPETPENTPPREDEVRELNALITEMAKAGVLIATEGCQSSSRGARVRIDGAGRISVTDGPFPETKELIAGYCLIQVKSKEEAVEWGKRFLHVMRTGESEIRQLHDGPPRAA